MLVLLAQFQKLSFAKGIPSMHLPHFIPQNGTLTIGHSSFKPLYALREQAEDDFKIKGKLYLIHLLFRY